MKKRLFFGMIVGAIGAGIGAGIGYVLQKEDEPFPLHIVIALALIFAACGALANTEWLHALEDFFWHIVP